MDLPSANNTQTCKFPFFSPMYNICQQSCRYTLHCKISTQSIYRVELMDSIRQIRCKTKKILTHVQGEEIRLPLCHNFQAPLPCMLWEIRRPSLKILTHLESSWHSRVKWSLCLPYLINSNKEEFVMLCVSGAISTDKVIIDNSMVTQH